MMGRRYIALIPAYEPDEKMTDTIRELKAKGFDIVVVDDGSGSACEELFLKAEEDAVVLTHETNRGKGAALKTGMEYIYKYMSYTKAVKTPGGQALTTGKGAVIVTVDADGQHLAEDAFRVARIAEANRNALVLGSRAFSGDVPARSMVGNTITRHVYSLATGVSVHDTQTGLRAFGREMIPRLLEIKGERYEYEINMLLELAKSGTPIIEEEIETVYEDGNKSSHFRTVSDSFKIYKEILKFSASSLVSFLIDYVMYGILIALTAAAGLSHSLIISNIGARLVSSVVNYSINRKFVFNSNSNIHKSALQYFMLAAVILIGNTIVLSTLVNTMGIGSMQAKLITEIIFFFISWTVQKYLIFYREEGADFSEKDTKEEVRMWKAELDAKHL